MLYDSDKMKKLDEMIGKKVKTHSPLVDIAIRDIIVKRMEQKGNRRIMK